MKTEDDTFKKLRQIPFEEMSHIYHQRCSNYYHNEILKLIALGYEIDCDGDPLTGAPLDEIVEVDQKLLDIRESTEYESNHVITENNWDIDEFHKLQDEYVDSKFHEVLKRLGLSKC